MSAFVPNENLKRAVYEHWSAEPCGTREVPEADRGAFFNQIERERYEIEPYIPAFADFESGRGKRVLEIGVGAATDFVNWARHGAVLVGIDLTEAGVAMAQERLTMEGLQGEVLTADAERLPFDDDVFDVVYSYGVLHHTPDSNRAIAEAIRVLKPGGMLKLMLYHFPSCTSILLWGYHCALRGRPWVSARRAVYDHLESPGTKSYTVAELRAMFAHLENLSVRIELTSGDLLSCRQSEKHRGPLADLTWWIYPRGLVKRFGRSLGHAALIQGRKPLV